jgi:hypothetical protein
LFVTNISPPPPSSASTTSDLTDPPINTHFRRITPEDLQTVLVSKKPSIEAATGETPAQKEEVENSTVCYICGPPAMTDSFVKVAEGIIGPERVFREKWW